MSRVTQAVAPPAPPRPNPLHRSLEVVVVPRSVVERDGWPEDWAQLRAQAVASVRDTLHGGGAETPDYSLRRMSLGELVQASYQPLNLAFFRAGPGNTACLVAQAWTT